VIKFSLVIMVGLTVLVAFGLRWREQRIPAVRAAAARPADGWVALQKQKLNRWLTAATIAALATILVLGGLHWLKVGLS
jgi:hypothetical protein